VQVFAQYGEVVRWHGRLEGVVGVVEVGYVLALVVDEWLSDHESELLVMVQWQVWLVAMGLGLGLVGHLCVLTLRQRWLREWLVAMGQGLVGYRWVLTLRQKWSYRG